MKIHIEWLSDWADCEACGPSGANGARVTIDGALVLDLQPVAHCCDGVTYEPDEVFKRILAHLGHEVDEVEASTDE